MIRCFFILLITATSISFMKAQDKMIVNKPHNGNTFYGKSSAYLTSMSETPSLIQLNVTGFLNKVFGPLSSNVKFSHGQVVDLKEYFSNDSLTFDRGRIVPKYDLNFTFQDTTIGIKNYYLQIRLDEYGQILYANWPNEKYSNKNKFISRYDVEQFALRMAKMKEFEITNYIVDLEYNEKLAKLCWVFKFPVVIDNNIKEYNVLEIDWNWLQIADEYIEKN